MSKEKLVPKLRFEEFWRDNIWELKSLEETVDITMGQSPSSKNYTNNPSDYILVQGNSDLKNGKVFPRIWTTQVTKKANKGDLILSVRAPVGDVGKTDYDVVLGRGVAAITGNEFIYQLLTKMKVNNYWTNLITGSTFESINSNDIKDAKVFFPRKEEQNKIGTFFKKIDEMIQLQQSKVNKVKDIKSAYLSEMFPKEGEKYPKKRFEGFTDPWKETRLSDFVSKAVDNRGKTPPLSDEGTHPLIEVASIGDYYPNYSKVEKYLDDIAFDNNLRGYIKQNDILFSTVGRIGLVSLMDHNKDAAIAQNIVAFRATENNIPEYIYALLSAQTNKEKSERIVMGAVQPSIKVSQLENVKYLITDNIKEQQLIGSFFAKLENIIIYNQNHLMKLKELKIAYLNDMFV